MFSIRRPSDQGPILQRALRILLIMHQFGEPTEKAGAVLELEGITKLVKLDFLFARPDCLALDLLMAVKNGELTSPIERKAVQELVAQIFDEQEPEIHQEVFYRHFYGPFVSLDQVLARLTTLTLARQKTDRRADDSAGRKTYFLTAKGERFIVEKLLPEPAFAWYTRRVALLYHYNMGLNGHQLMKRLYRHLDIEAVEKGKPIDSYQKEVMEIYAELYQRTLA